MSQMKQVNHRYIFFSQAPLKLLDIIYIQYVLDDRGDMKRDMTYLFNRREETVTNTIHPDMGKASEQEMNRNSICTGFDL